MHKTTLPRIGRKSDAARLRRGVIYQAIASAALLAVVLAYWPRVPAPPVSRAATRPLAPAIQPLEQDFTPSSSPQTPKVRIGWMQRRPVQAAPCSRLEPTWRTRHRAASPGARRSEVALPAQFDLAASELIGAAVDARFQRELP
jgi:hypothetical protein